MHMSKVNIVRGHDTLNTVFSILGNNLIVCGGFARWACSTCVDPVVPGDIDIYPDSWDSYSRIIEKFQKDFKYSPQHESAVAVSYSFEYGPLKGMLKFQIIKPINNGAIVALGSLEEVVNSFDFTCIRVGIKRYDDGSYLTYADPDFITDEFAKRLVIKNIHCPISEVKRIAKYTTKGYTISPTELLKLYENWEERTVEYKDDLKSNLKALREVGSWWDLDGDTRDNITTLLYVD